jgi:hypothetical protein
MKTHLLIYGVAVIAGSVICAALLLREPSVPVVPPTVRSPATNPSIHAVRTEPPRPQQLSPVVQPSRQPAKTSLVSAASGAKAKTMSNVANNSPTAADEPEKPIARQALTLVGADPVAEQIWIASINDPTISPHDRQDLIEDLNEEGFDDPKNLTPDDLPLIENRIALIEDLAPGSMDDVNAAAFAEAYKDLVNMHAKVAGQ